MGRDSLRDQSPVDGQPSPSQNDVQSHSTILVESVGCWQFILLRSLVTFFEMSSVYSISVKTAGGPLKLDLVMDFDNPSDYNAVSIQLVSYLMHCSNGKTLVYISAVLWLIFITGGYRC